METRALRTSAYDLLNPFTNSAQMTNYSQRAVGASRVLHNAIDRLCDSSLVCSGARCSWYLGHPPGQLQQHQPNASNCWHLKKPSSSSEKKSAFLDSRYPQIRVIFSCFNAFMNVSISMYYLDYIVSFLELLRKKFSSTTCSDHRRFNHLLKFFLFYSSHRPRNWFNSNIFFSDQARQVSKFH